MKKDAYYFPHDSNAKDDPKCVLLIDQLGLEGYGIFWILIETLREQPDYKYPLNLLPALARRYNTSAEKIGTVVRSYELFNIEDEKIFFSESLIKRMLPLEDKKEKARIAAEIRWKKYERNANALQSHSEGNTNAMLIREENIKGKEIKRDNRLKADRFSPPTVEEIKIYCLERGNKVDSEKFYDFYLSKNWMIGKNKMKDWKAAVRTWEKREDNREGGNNASNQHIKPDEKSQRDYSERF
ncbi:DUF4373 domain-containing protein [Parabacteroides sp. PF5-9]|uniref:DUF4373 domain-containing protein n=1 Tax=Parabacteroides sp. PF5-9 TaxID=1742404 RepID=UPI0024738169|nr:DUF4373 domain-containing protein [Parabacteroides sp. PF5-9]MDH6357635.1 hypothetical protein [Parabacteroides sp. PF5-9]